MAARYLPTVPHSVNVTWADDPADGICEVAESTHADLIAMGTHGRAGMGHALLGSVAEDVMRKASVPVLVVRHGTVPLHKTLPKLTPDKRSARAQVGKERLLTYLNLNRASFMLDHHSPAFSAHEMATVEHLPDHMVAKVVLAFAGEALAMFVIPAEARLDRRKARHLLGAADIRLATEDQMAAYIPDCEVGAVHPFGNLYGIPVYADKGLVAQRALAFFAGTHADTVYLEAEDYTRLAQPVLADIASSSRGDGRQADKETK
jgi:Ala-tRNA(Pro) deacylase